MANQITVIGRLGRDAETKSVSGTSLLTFSVADDTGFGDKKVTTWWRVSVWGKQAEGRLPEFLKKGTQVAVFGEASAREHDGKIYLEIRANSVQLIGAKGDAPAPTSSAAPAPARTATAPAFEEDLPF